MRRMLKEMSKLDRDAEAGLAAKFAAAWPERCAHVLCCLQEGQSLHIQRALVQVYRWAVASASALTVTSAVSSSSASSANPVAAAAGQLKRRRRGQLTETWPAHV